MGFGVSYLGLGVGVWGFVVGVRCLGFRVVFGVEGSELERKSWRSESSEPYSETLRRKVRRRTKQKLRGTSQGKDRPWKS